ncbi:xylulokinase [Murinocardiopsis flavida]|uniref:Xylulokinase n=1 Tax=Murinocardiopsis flavida TaxID=645275 RepID=A0A2P8DFC2_9ACTN|nr:FGGY family carbohydrate kinase [Murinocardiopsis flavida]PSK95909.1 xylulokinase [Murinocardiopsis flavida]
MSTGPTGPLYLGVDLGTSSVKAALLDSGGELHGVSAAAYTLSSPDPSWAEIDPRLWWDAAARAVRACTARRADRVAAVGLSGQMHGVVLSDADGAAVRPAILWPDGRAADRLDRFTALPGDARARLANPPMPGAAGPMLVWLADHEAAALARARWALQPKDWLRLRLTGRAATEPSDASGTLLYDLAADDWAYDVAARLGLRGDLLAPVLPSARSAGGLTREAADALGLRPGTPVAAGAADTAAAALGAALRPGDVQLTIGTGAQVVALADRIGPAPDPRTNVFRTAAPQGYYRLSAIANAGLALEWAVRVFGATWDELYAAAEGDGAGAPVFVPHLAPERGAGLAAGAFTGLKAGHDRADLLHAVLRGVAGGIADAVAALEPDGAAPVRVAGGGARDPRWLALLRRVLGRRLDPVPVHEASVRGAALLAAASTDAPIPPASRP